VGTSIAVAFARNPMNLANLAHDLQNYTQGRFILGLGSQIKPHIERRFSMPWSHPAPRMREMISAIRAIWAAWDDGEPLDFRGDFYSHTLMTPFFAPPPSQYGKPELYLAAVGEAMTKVAGEVTDGLFVHPFTTERYLRERTLPALAEGAAKGSRSLDDIALSLSGFVVTAEDEKGMAAAIAGTRQQIAFYGSTPAYRGVLELHGWGEVGDELNALSRTDDDGKWKEMGELVSDEMLHTFAIVGEPDTIGPEVHRRFGDVVHRFGFYTAYEAGDALLARLASAVKNG
jgi:probable F420-dependent oxidoreductase